MLYESIRSYEISSDMEIQSRNMNTINILNLHEISIMPITNINLCY